MIIGRYWRTGINFEGAYLTTKKRQILALKGHIHMLLSILYLPQSSLKHLTTYKVDFLLEMYSYF